MPEKTNANAPNTSSLSSTRQLLDELDALMDRMLALPVGETESEARPENDSAMGVALMPPPDEAETSEADAEKDEPLKLDDSLDLTDESSEQANYFFDEPETNTAVANEDELTAPQSTAGEDWHSDEPEEEKSDLSFGPQPIGGELFSYLQKAKNTKKTESELNSTGVFTPPAGFQLAWWLRPVAWLNRGFDLFTHIFGPLGDWLREPGGRTFLGLLGATLILAAITIQILLWVTWN